MGNIAGPENEVPTNVTEYIKIGKVQAEVIRPLGLIEFRCPVCKEANTYMLPNLDENISIEEYSKKYLEPLLEIFKGCHRACWPQEEEIEAVLYLLPGIQISDTINPLDTEADGVENP